MLFFFIIGSMFWWYRYVTPLIISLNLLYPILYNYYFKDDFKNRIVFLIYLIAVCISALFMVIASYYDFKNHELRVNPYEQIGNVLVENDLHYGFVYSGREHNVYRLLTNNNLQVTRLYENGMPDYWLASKNWFDSKYYDKKVFFMRMKNENHLNCEKNASSILDYEDYDIVIFDKIDDLLCEYK